MKARPASEWHEDYGTVLWWHVPVCEPPFVSKPGDSDWEDFMDDWYTHWTPIPEPDFGEAGLLEDTDIETIAKALE